MKLNGSWRKEKKLEQQNVFSLRKQLVVENSDPKSPLKAHVFDFLRMNVIAFPVVISFSLILHKRLNPSHFGDLDRLIMHIQLGSGCLRSTQRSNYF